MSFSHERVDLVRLLGLLSLVRISRSTNQQIRTFGSLATQGARAWQRRSWDPGAG